jgi:hypothetical protein
MHSTRLVVILVAALTLSISASAQAKNVRNPVPVVGKTADGRYPIYDIEGDLTDIAYSTSKSTIYHPDELPERIGFISNKDAKNKAAYDCEFVCKDKAGHVVGMNPSWAKLYKMKVPADK